MTKRKTYGVGIADIPTKNGDKHTSQYKKWNGMLERCYSSRLHKTRPTYIGCSCSDEWKTLSKFSEWYDNNAINGWHLDKDIKYINNKYYNEATCVFVPQYVNALLNMKLNSRGDCPVGVFYKTQKMSNNYCAQIALGKGKQKHIGYFSNPYDAFIAYKTERLNYVRHVAKMWYESHLIDLRTFLTLSTISFDEDGIWR